MPAVPFTSQNFFRRCLGDPSIITFEPLGKTRRVYTVNISTVRMLSCHYIHFPSNGGTKQIVFFFVQTESIIIYTYLVLVLSDVAGVVSVVERATVVDHCKQGVAATERRENIYNNSQLRCTYKTLSELVLPVVTGSGATGHEGSHVEVHGELNQVGDLSRAKRMFKSLQYYTCIMDNFLVL